MSDPTPLRRFLQRVALLFGPLTAVWLLGIATPYADAVFGVADVALSLDTTLDAEIAPDDHGVPTVYETSSERQAVISFNREGLFFNVIVLTTLLLATPSWSWQRRLTRWMAGLPLLTMAHVGFVYFQAKAQLINVGPLDAPSALRYAINWLTVLFGPIGEVLFPLLIAAAISWGAWRSAFGLAQPIVSAEFTSAGRNDHCPCGSGRKYKHCCGRR